MDDVLVTTRDASRLLGKQISWVLQSVNLLPRRSVLDNTLLPCRAHRAEPERSRARAEASFLAQLPRYVLETALILGFALIGGVFGLLMSGEYLSVPASVGTSTTAR